MDWDEAKFITAKSVTFGEDLSTLSIAELDARIAALDAEITRVRAVIDKKKQHETAASALFKKP